MTQTAAKPHLTYQKYPLGSPEWLAAMVKDFGLNAPDPATTPLTIAPPVTKIRTCYERR